MKTDQEMDQLISDLLDICDNYINFDYLVVQDQEKYELMKVELKEFLRNQDI
jgi:hypothetical protein